VTRTSRLISRLWPERLRAASVIEGRNRTSQLASIGIYVIMSMSFIAASVALSNTVRFVERNAVLSSRQPLFLPISLIVVVFSFMLTLAAALTVARERDRGTFRVLMFAPVDEVAFVLGNFAAQIRTYVVMALFGLVWASLATYFLNLAFSTQVLLAFAASVPTVAAVVAFGLLIGIWGGKTRTAIAYLVLIALAFIGLQIGGDVVANTTFSQSPTQNDPIVVVRNVIIAANSAIQWVSPYAQMSQGLDAILDGNLGKLALHIAVTVAQSTVFLLAAVLVLKRKGSG